MECKKARRIWMDRKREMEGRSKERKKKKEGEKGGRKTVRNMDRSKEEKGGQTGR